MFLLYWSVIHALSLYEMNILLSVSKKSFIVNTIASQVIFACLAAPHFSSFSISLGIWYPLAFAPFIGALLDSQGNFWKSSVAAISITWITIPCYVAFRFSLDPYFMIGLLNVIWFMDAGAYFAGKLFGRTPLLERISPRKTIEGTLGGAVVTFIIAHVVSKYVKTYGDIMIITHFDWMVIALISVVFGQLGDLFESMFKRALQAKDSGNLIPGHGGLLDRFDAVFFVVIFVNSYLSF
jgi:phosphatidate cytidylyltransferase